MRLRTGHDTVLVHSPLYAAQMIAGEIKRSRTGGLGGAPPRRDDPEQRTRSRLLTRARRGDPRAIKSLWTKYRLILS